jgi:hypothetical protein
VIVGLAMEHPGWGHRKFWAMARHSGYRLSQRTVARLLDAEGLLLKADYQRERRELAKARKAAFAAAPTGPNQVWQLDFSEYETTAGGTWRVAGIADYWSKYEFGWHWSPTANQHDAVAAVELALTETQRLLGPVSLVEHLTDPDTGEIVPITLVTDNGGPFRSFRFGALIVARSELRHVRTRIRSPGRTAFANGPSDRSSTNGSTANRSTTLSTSSARATRSASSSTRPDPTRRSPGTDPSTSTSATPTPPPSTSPNRKPCQLLDTGQRFL